uniref:Mcl1_mid domain-containing protein n=1 Tax=Toxocara canis TaxID=6265 RepID=A0A183TYU0_TOXCA
LISPPKLAYRNEKVIFPLILLNLQSPLLDPSKKTAYFGLTNMHTHGGWVFEWPTTKILQEEAMMTDSFRKLHPNPLLEPGNTWSTVVKTSGDGWSWTIPEPQDRIDFIFYKSHLLEPLFSYTYEGNDMVWPSPYHREAMSGFDRDEIRKALVALTRKEFERFKEEVGGKFLDEDADCLTYETWSELGALDADMTADALDCYADLVEALRQETLAKKQLNMASANVFKAFQAVIATLSQSAVKFQERREEVKARRLLFESEETRRIEKIISVSDGVPPKQNQKNVYFRDFGMKSLLSRASELQSRTDRQLIVEARSGTFTTQPIEPLVNMQQEQQLNRLLGKAVSRPAGRLHFHEEEKAVNALVKVSLNGSLTEERDTAHDDLKISTPRPPNFDDEDSFSSTDGVVVSGLGRYPVAAFLLPPTMCKIKPEARRPAAQLNAANSASGSEQTSRQFEIR